MDYFDDGAYVRHGSIRTEASAVNHDELSPSLSGSNEEEFYTFQPYSVPKWAEGLNNIPKHFVKLSNLNTPLHKWNLPGVPSCFVIYIKRDDMTSAALSGSKVRPLQIMFAEALSEGAKHVIIGGPPQSGCSRAVCLASRLLGLTPHFLVLGGQEIESLGAKGNTLLSRLAGSKIYLAPDEHLETFNKRIVQMAHHISEVYGEKCCAIPAGGTTAKAEFMYLSMFEELLRQGIHERFDDVVVAAASGGISVGLAIGNYLTGSSVRVHALTVFSPKEEDIHDRADTLLHQLGIDSVKSRDILDVIDGYIGEGYAKATDSLLEFITKVSSTTGILLDPCYTGKAAFGMVEELNRNPNRFKGKRILFIHTGGIFNLFDGVMDRVIYKENSNTNDVTYCQIDAAEKTHMNKKSENTDIGVIQ